MVGMSRIKEKYLGYFLLGAGLGLIFAALALSGCVTSRRYERDFERDLNELHERIVDEGLASQSANDALKKRIEALEKCSCFEVGKSCMTVTPGYQELQINTTLYIKP